MQQDEDHRIVLLLRAEGMHVRRRGIARSIRKWGTTNIPTNIVKVLLSSHVDDRTKSRRDAFTFVH